MEISFAVLQTYFVKQSLKLGLLEDMGDAISLKVNILLFICVSFKDPIASIATKYVLKDFIYSSLNADLPGIRFIISRQTIFPPLSVA